MPVETFPLKAVIFDFDGVIVDSEPLHYRAFQKVLKPFGLHFSFDEYLEYYIGFDDRDAFKEAFRQEGRELSGGKLSELIGSKSMVFEEIVRKDIKPFPGAKGLVREVANHGIPMAIASGALRNEIELILKMLSLRAFFKVIVSADRVTRSKPDPETYKVAVEELKKDLGLESLEPELCVAIEDTPAGVQSAKGAGLRVIAVGHSYNLEDLADADCVVERLADLSFSIMVQVVKDVREIP